jgi:hypothetical protein
MFVCDGYHSSVFGPTDPNRLMAMSASIDPSGGHGGPVITTASNRVDVTGKLSWKTMPEALLAAGVSWKVYDENGGFFDHVPPPAAPAGTAGEYLTGTLPSSAGGIAGPVGLGFRTPALVISPFSAGGYKSARTSPSSRRPCSTRSPAPWTSGCPTRSPQATPCLPRRQPPAGPRSPRHRVGIHALTGGNCSDNSKKRRRCVAATSVSAHCRELKWCLVTVKTVRGLGRGARD